MDLITTRDMRALEVNAEYFGLSLLQLMENAGSSIACEVANRFPEKKSRIVVFCGLGGNGGDGFVAARHLISMGYRVKIIVCGKASEIRHRATLQNWYVLQSLKSHITIEEVLDSTMVPEIKGTVVIDALLGVGIKGTLKQPILELVKTINQTQSYRLAVDTPTGLDSDTGRVLGEAVRADLTITFHKAKPGLVKAKEYVGELIVKSIGLPESFEKLAGPGDVGLVVKERAESAHKGDFGSLLVVGGSETYSGAPTLVALASLRTGNDLAFIATPEKTALTISSISPNLITIKLKGTHLNPDNISQIERVLPKVSAVVLGPGLGLHEETKETVGNLIGIIEKREKPLVLDADGLKVFSEYQHSMNSPLILTPHSKEYSILTGKELPSNLEERVEKVQRTAFKLNATILLKGSTDIITDGKRVKLNSTGNPGMTVGGTGDVLAGIVGAFMAQQSDPFEAAAAGAFINGAAGDFVKAQKGYHMLPTDLLDWIPKVIDNPKIHSKVHR